MRRQEKIIRRNPLLWHQPRREEEEERRTNNNHLIIIINPQTTTQRNTPSLNSRSSSHRQQQIRERREMDEGGDNNDRTNRTNVSNYDDIAPSSNDDTTPAAGTCNVHDDPFLPPAPSSLPTGEEDTKLIIPPPLPSSPSSALVSPQKNYDGAKSEFEPTTVKLEIKTPPSTSTKVPQRTNYATISASSIPPSGDDINIHQQQQQQQQQQYLLPPINSTCDTAEKSTITAPQPQSLLLPFSITSNSAGDVGTAGDSNAAVSGTDPPIDTFCESTPTTFGIDPAATIDGINSATATATTGTLSPVNTKPILKQDQWNQMLNRLRAFKKKHGHTLVPKRYKDDPKLGMYETDLCVVFLSLD